MDRWSRTSTGPGIQSSPQGNHLVEQTWAKRQGLIMGRKTTPWIVMTHDQKELNSKRGWTTHPCGRKKLRCMRGFATCGHMVAIQLSPPMNPPLILSRKSHPTHFSLYAYRTHSEDSMPLSEPISLEKIPRLAYSNSSDFCTVRIIFISINLTIVKC